MPPPSPRSSAAAKPVDQATLPAAAATGGRLVIAEDHYPQGGLDAAVLEALAGTGLEQPGPREALVRLRTLAAGKPVTLLTATKDLGLSQAAVLAGLLREAP